MEKRKTIEPDMTVKELIKDYPQAGKVFIKEGLLCFGCPTESFHTLADVAREYQMNLNDFLKRLQNTIQEIKEK